MVPDALKEKVLDYLSNHNTMTLATCGGGDPWAATVFYANDGLRLYFFSSPESRHCQNLSVHPRVAATIQEDYHDWRAIKGIQLEGKASPVQSVVEKSKALAAYGRKYPEILRLFTDPRSGIYHRAFLKVRFYSVAPERLFFIDNEQGFGKRQELSVAE